MRPVKSITADERSMTRILGSLPLFVRSVVTHPDALRDPLPYRELGTRLVLENMDDRKPTGRTADRSSPLAGGPTPTPTATEIADRARRAPSAE